MAQDVAKVRNISFVVFCVGFLLFLIGFSAPYWMDATDDVLDAHYHEGLWRRCYDGPLIDYGCWNMEAQWTDASVKATKAFMCLSLIALCLAMMSYFCWMSQSQSHMRQNGLTDVGRAALYVTGSAGCMNFLGIIIYGCYFVNGGGELLHWAYALCVVSAFIFTFGGFIAVCVTEVRNNKRITSDRSAPHNARSSSPGNPGITSGPGMQTGYPPTHRSPIYFTGQDTDQPVNVAYQSWMSNDQDSVPSTYSQTPPYSEMEQPPPSYRPEWLNKNHQGITDVQDTGLDNPVYAH